MGVVLSIINIIIFGKESMRLRTQTIDNGKGRVLAGTSGAVMVLVLGAMLFPSLPTAVQAEESGSTANLNVESAVAITLPDTVAINVTPTPDGTFSSSNVKLSVSTNNNSGYTLSLATTGNDNHMHSQNQATTETIAPVSGSVTQAKFANNTWGYNLRAASEGDANASTEYQAVPESDDAALKTTSAPSNDSYNLTFGAKVNTSIPSGTYTNTVAVSVVANPPLVADMTSLSTMQEMTPEVCAETEVGTVARLTDARDQKQYWVTKLADGNCWMTQNLDLDLANGTPLTPEDSDVSSNWNPPRTTEQLGTITSANTNTETYSWDLGMYVKSDPDGYSDYCGGSSIKGLSDSTCTSAGWTDVSSMTPMADGTTNEVISTDNNTYNAHYLVGNLYQWNAATAGTGGTITGQDATDSICPKGWQLPTSNNSNSGSFQALMNAYSIGNDSTKITQSPLYFHPSGYVYSGSLRYAGYGGNYWSSTADSSASDAYYLSFYSGGVAPSDYNYRYRGQSVRCLASQ